MPTTCKYCGSITNVKREGDVLVCCQCGESLVEASSNDLTACELFAGVGGFHLGLSKSGWKVVWADQYEPGKKKQHAFDCYNKHYPGVCVNKDITKVPTKTIPPTKLLVGGFPCQDYSVATTNAHGIEGKKGVLWWDIARILEESIDDGNPVPFVILENVDRLLKSPTRQRGRDFGIILKCLTGMGYVVEWRVINAADYGFPQKRRRTFIFATRNEKTIRDIYRNKTSENILKESGFFAPKFPVSIKGKYRTGDLNGTLQYISDSFEFKFENSGYAMGNQIVSVNTVPSFGGDKKLLKEVLEKNVDSSFFVEESAIEKWKYCKGAKAEPRKDKSGFVYNYTEGAIPFPDILDGPSRTILTSDGNKTPNRATHLILDPKNNRYRILTPLEMERLNGFDDNWTEGMPQRWRYFCMGNALVVGVVELLGKRLKEIVDGEKNVE